MIFRTAFLATVSACLVCASDQTLGPGFETQPASARDITLLRALKAASTESLGINRLQHLSQPTSNFTLDIVPKLPRITAPPLLMGRAGPRSSHGIHCSIPLIPMAVKPTHDVVSRTLPLQAFDQGIGLPPPAPACPTK